MSTTAQSPATNEAAVRAIAAGDFAGAEAALLQALAQDRGNLATWLNLAAVRRQRQDVDGAFDALREALAVDARDFRALLMSATLLEQIGHAKPAASAFSFSSLRARSK